MNKIHDVIVRLAASPNALVWSATIEFPALQRRLELMGRMGEAPMIDVPSSRRLHRAASVAAFKTIAALLKTPYGQKASVRIETSWKDIAESIYERDEKIIPEWINTKFEVDVSLVPNHLEQTDLDAARYLVGYLPKKPRLGTQMATFEVPFNTEEVSNAA